MVVKFNTIIYILVEFKINHNIIDMYTLILQ